MLREINVEANFIDTHGLCLLAASLGSAARGAVGPAGARHEGGGSRPLAQAQRGALAAAAAQGAHRRCIFALQNMFVGK